MLGFVAWDVTSDSGLARVVGPVALGLDLWIAVLAKRLGNSMRLEQGAGEFDERSGTLNR